MAKCVAKAFNSSHIAALIKILLKDAGGSSGELSQLFALMCLGEIGTEM